MGKSDSIFDSPPSLQEKNAFPVNQHEYNSDQTTHKIISSICDQRYIYYSASQIRENNSPSFTIQEKTITTFLYPLLKHKAECHSRIIANRAFIRAQDKSRWSGNLTFSKVIAEVLLDKDIRRGPLPSQAEKEARITFIESSLAHPSGFQMVLLMLPIRDRHPAKNDGPFPDLGEVNTLLRLWTVPRTIEIVRELFIKTPVPLTHQELTTPIRIIAIRDSKRYPSYSTDPLSDLQAYNEGLEKMLKDLKIEDLVEVTLLDTLESKLKKEEVISFHAQRDVIYSKKFNEINQPFQENNELLNISDRTLFLEKIQSVDKSKKMAELFECILHGRWHPELTEKSALFRLEFLVNIYTPYSDENLETLRQKVIRSCLIGAAQYIAAYEANTKKKNQEGLDDIEFLLPGRLRLSFHTKPEYYRQFTIQIGPSIHRTPWHGTVALRQHPKKKGTLFEVRLSLELKNENYVPVFISYSDKNNKIFSSMVDIGQPFLWIAKELIPSFTHSPVDNDDVIITHLIQEVKHL